MAKSRSFFIHRLQPTRTSGGEKRGVPRSNLSAAQRRSASFGGRTGEARAWTSMKPGSHGRQPGAQAPQELTRGPFPDLSSEPSLLANLLHEGPGAASVRALVVHDLREQPRFRVLCQDRGGAHLEGELHTF